MLLSPAYAAESGTSDSSANAAVTTAAEARSVKLVFASDKTLTGANGDTEPPGRAWLQGLHADRGG